MSNKNSVMNNEQHNIKEMKQIKEKLDNLYNLYYNNHIVNNSYCEDVYNKSKELIQQVDKELLSNYIEDQKNIVTKKCDLEDNSMIWFSSFTASIVAIIGLTFFANNKDFFNVLCIAVIVILIVLVWGYFFYNRKKQSKEKFKTLFYDFIRNILNE